MKPFTALVPAIILLACLALPCTALESKFFTITEKTISLELGPGFEMVSGEFNTSENGMVRQDFIINNTGASGAAFVSVMSVYDETMSKMSPGALSELFLIGGISAVEAEGAVEIGNWTAVDSQGRNVTVHTLSTNDERVEKLGGSYDMAVWNLDGPNFAVMVSLFDHNNTTKTIKTLTIS
ncbi:MAG: hypothetical protein M0Q13_02930 [Methanothrix sp.]|jgi:hypothetical protein|nr:hypothetical protein [Methanothrix sp.]